MKNIELTPLLSKRIVIFYIIFSGFEPHVIGK